MFLFVIIFELFICPYFIIPLFILIWITSFYFLRIVYGFLNIRTVQKMQMIFIEIQINVTSILKLMILISIVDVLLCLFGFLLHQPFIHLIFASLFIYLNKIHEH